MALFSFCISLYYFHFISFRPFFSSTAQFFMCCSHFGGSNNFQLLSLFLPFRPNSKTNLKIKLKFFFCCSSTRKWMIAMVCPTYYVVIWLFRMLCTSLVWFIQRWPSVMSTSAIDSQKRKQRNNFNKRKGTKNKQKLKWDKKKFVCIAFGFHVNWTLTTVGRPPLVYHYAYIYV